MIAESVWLLVELVVLFFGVTFLVQLAQRRMGTDRLRTWMGGHPFVAALKGIAIGFLTPFCTFTAIPMLIGLRQARVPPAGYVAFIVAAPVLDPVLFGALVIIVGLEVALIYLATAFSAAIGLAMIAQTVGIERHLRPINTDILQRSGGPGSQREATQDVDPTSEVTSTSCRLPIAEPWRGLRRETPPAAAAAGTLLRTMGPLLLLGIGISLLLDAAVPPDVTERLTSASPTFAIPIAAAVGTPLYVSTGVFVPIADSLRAAGVDIGAVVALTIAGAGANLPEFVILGKLAKPRIIAIFFSYVFGVAVVGGFLASVAVGP